jgi:hypothetical protein
MLRVSLVLLGSLALSSSALAGSKEDACIVEATGRLPVVPGLKIVNSAVRTSGPPGAKSLFYDVTLAIEAAGRAVKYQFTCRDNGSDDVVIVKRKVLD